MSQIESVNQLPDPELLKKRAGEIYKKHEKGKSGEAYKEARELFDAMPAWSEAPNEVSQTALRLVFKDLSRILVVTGMSALKQGQVEHPVQVMKKVLTVVNLEYPIGATEDEAAEKAQEWIGVYHADAPSAIEAIEDLVGLCELLQYLFDDTLDDQRFVSYSHALLQYFLYALDFVPNDLDLEDHPGLLKFRIKHSNIYDSNRALVKYLEQHGVGKDGWDFEEIMSLRAHNVFKQTGFATIHALFEYFGTSFRASWNQKWYSPARYYQNLKFSGRELSKKSSKISGHYLKERFKDKQQFIQSDKFIGLAADFDFKRVLGVDNPNGDAQTHDLGFGTNGGDKT